MKKIRKSATIFLTQEEVDSPNPIEIKLTVRIKGHDESIDYTIRYPKLDMPKSLPPLKSKV
jgi:hypothetical protein